MDLAGRGGRVLAGSIANPSGRLASAAFAATTARNASMAASATTWSIAGAWCCGPRCTRRLFKIARASPCSWRGADGQFPRAEHLWVDQGYTGSGKTWIEQNLGWRVEVVRHPPHPRGEWVPHGDLARIETVWFSWSGFRQGQESSAVCCQDGAWLSAHSPGCARTDASAGTTSDCAPRARPSFMRPWDV
jgi:hypothetical protein